MGATCIENGHHRHRQSSIKSSSGLHFRVRMWLQCGRHSRSRRFRSMQCRQRS
jgi:hypothetical protein